MCSHSVIGTIHPMGHFAILTCLLKPKIRGFRSGTSYLEELFHSFVAACSDMHEKSFYSKQNRFNVLLYESVFAAVCSGPFKSRELVKNAITQLKFNNLKDDPKFIAATQTDTASKINVNARLDRALTLLS